jgi:hypothetical protein
MNGSTFRRWLFPGLAAAAILTGMPSSTFAQSGAGYMVLDPLDESLGSLVNLSGTITNQCTATLPSGSTFIFEFDGVAFAKFPITTALTYGGQQSFSLSAALPSGLKPPKKNTTSLDFTIALPKKDMEFGGIPDQKTSPCFVTFVPGTPP